MSPAGDGAGRTPATVGAWLMAVSVAAFVAAALADAAWGWDGSAGALYGVGSILLVISAGLLVVTQVGLSRMHGGLGRVAMVGVGVTSLGALLSFVSWAVVLWATVMGVGTLLFGAALLRRGRVPRESALPLTFAAPAIAVTAWTGAILSDVTDSSLVAGGAEVLTAAAVLVLAWGLAGVGRWMATARA